MRTLGVVAVVFLLVGCGGRQAGEDLVEVADVIDGDTLVLAGGERVRLVQIDAPELDGGECFASAARDELASLTPPGTEVRLETDRALDLEDRFGRMLRYVIVGETVVNVELVARGAAAPYFFGGARGRLADDLVESARRARAERRGLWGACSATRLEPERQVDARR